MADANETIVVHLYLTGLGEVIDKQVPQGTSLQAWLESEEINPNVPFLAVLVNGVLEPLDYVLHDGDEIAFAPKGARNAAPDFVAPDWPRLLSVEALAAYLSIAPQTIRNNQHKIPGMCKLGQRTLFDRREIDRWLDGNDGLRNLWVDAARSVELESARTKET